MGTPRPPRRKLQRRQTIAWRRQTKVQRTSKNMEEYIHHRDTHLMDGQKVHTSLTCQTNLRKDETASRNWRDVTCPTCWAMRTYGVPADGHQQTFYQEAYCAEEIYFRGNRSHQCTRIRMEPGLYCRQHEAINFPRAFPPFSPTAPPGTPA